MGGKMSWEEAPLPLSLSPGGLPRGGLSGGGEEVGREGEGRWTAAVCPGRRGATSKGTGRGVVLPTFLSYSNVFVWFNNSQIWLVKQKWPDKKANLSIQPPSKCKKSS